MTTKTVKLSEIVWKDSGREIDKAHVAELARSIKEVGLVNPIAVAALPDGTFEGRAGRHRYEAVKSLGEKTIDVQVLDLDETGQRLARIHENLKRKDLDPIERAREFRGFLEIRRATDPKVTQETVAKELQVSGPAFSNALMLLDQPAGVQDLLASGRITPGHVEHVLGPLRKRVPQATDEQLSGFAGRLAKEGLDIRTAKDEMRWAAEQFESDVKGAALEAQVAKAKVRTCPACERGWEAEPASAIEVDGRLVLQCSSYQPHKWDALTGELLLTPAERKAFEAQKAKDAKTRKAAAKREPRVKVERDYSVIFSRAELAQWAHARLDAIDTRLRDADWSDGRLSCGGDHGSRDLGESVYATPVELADGKGGTFRTRLVIGSFTARSNGTDHVAEGTRDVKDLRKIRKELLEFQRKTIKVKQADDDLWPVSVGAFALGEKVRIGAKSDIKSYVGKQGTILAFDTEYAYDRTGKEGVFAVLDIAASTKHHPVRVLEKIEARPKKAGTAKAAKAAKK